MQILPGWPPVSCNMKKFTVICLPLAATWVQFACDWRSLGYNFNVNDRQSCAFFSCNERPAWYNSYATGRQTHIISLPSGNHTARKIPLMYYFPGNCAASAPISTFMCLWAIYIFPGSVHIFPCSRSWKYINFSQIYECRNWETQHYNSVLEIKVSFLGTHKWEPDIYIGFSPALHLQCSGIPSHIHKI
jgi:hypothetical protein